MRQSQIAQQHGISSVTLNRILNGKLSLSATSALNAVKLSKMLGIAVDEIVEIPADELKRRFFELYECEVS